MDTYFYYGIVQNMVMHGYECFLRIFMKKFEKTQSMSPLVQSMFFTMPLTSIDVLLHGEDVFNMGRMFSIWGGCSLYGEDVLYMGRMFSIWGGCSLYGEDVLYMGRMFSIWGECSLYGEDVLYMGRMFSIWGGCSLYGEDVLYMERML